jgi:IS5 family transposase
LFVPRLDELINMKHPLVRLAALIDWEQIERDFSVSFTSGRGRPALAPRLVAGLLYLQHTFDASDQAVVNTWVENPYWQYFCGETYLQTELPIDPSSLTRCQDPGDHWASYGTSQGLCNTKLSDSPRGVR